MSSFTMPPHSLLLFLLFIIILTSMSDSFDQDPRYDYGFSYDNGFFVGELLLQGVASTTSGALVLTNGLPHRTGHAFHRRSFGSVSSFSATFVFLIIPPENLGGLSGHGLAFTLSTKTDFMFSALSSQYLGILDAGNNGNVTNQLFAVEFDTIKNREFADIDDNHVGIDANNMVSINSHTAGFYTSSGTFSPLKLASGEAMQVWVDYDGNSHNLNVSLAPYLEHKPQRPLLSNTVNFTSVLGNDSFYTGFSSATGTVASTHYIIGWSFNTTGEAQLHNYSGMSQVIKEVRQEIEDGQAAQNRSYTQREIVFTIVIPAVFIVLVIPVVIYALRKKARKNGEWEIECGPPSFTYKDLATATRRFSERMVLGKGGFGKVYKGVLQTSKQNVAIKRVSPESKQGMKEFIAEITILGHLRHRNVVQLLGYSRHKNELLLVYDYMPKGSLDRILHDQDRKVLNWVYRLNIIKGIASGLFYLHEDWEKVVIHRDIKTSNVLLDNEMNARLGDFGLARLHNHGTDVHTTHLAGTWGYIAPELARLGKATKETDVFAFGVFMLEVACGRRPIEVNNSGEPMLLTDWVLHAWESGSLIMTVDPRLEDYIKEEVELVLKLGLLCSHSVPSAGPCMRLVMQYLLKDAPLPDLKPCFFSLANRYEGFDQYMMSCPSVATATTGLSGGR